MVYVDKPKPSNGYVSYFILAALAAAVLLMLISITFTYTIWGQDLTPKVIISFISYYLPYVFLIGIAIHAAYNTEYRIENEKLWMKFGYLKKGSVSLDEIKCVEKVEFIILLSPRSNYCNKFKNGIRMTTEKRIIWVSPEDSERFISELELKTSR
ncbi:MAG: PH domain-containing protein [Candidatus Freyarchaeum deiterrae]